MSGFDDEYDYFMETERFRDIKFDRPKPDGDLGQHTPLRTRFTHPYSYDPVTIWGPAFPNERVTATVYTDRMSEWDHAKYDRIAREVYTDRPFAWAYCKGREIQEFLRRYFDDSTIVLYRVIEYCNASTGYPTWRLDYSSSK